MTHVIAGGQVLSDGASVTYFFKFGVWRRVEELQKHNFHVADRPAQSKDRRSLV
jgi:hypothetical protein